MSRIKEIKWVLTDPHFNHENLVKFARPEFKNAAEGNELIMANYNKVIKNYNTVVLFLGDIGDKLAIETLIPTLKGYKILILGNHDKYAKGFYEKYFDEVYDHPIYYHRRIVFSHIPIPVSQGVLNVHGHTHIISLDSANHMNISPELTNYELVKIKNIEQKAFALPKDVNKFLQEWYGEIQIDKATWDRVDLYTDKRGLIDVPRTQILMKCKNLMRKEMSKAEFRAILYKIREQMIMKSPLNISILEDCALKTVKLELKKFKKVNSK